MSPNNYTCGIINGTVSAISSSIVQNIAQLSIALIEDSQFQPHAVSFFSLREVSPSMANMANVACSCTCIYVYALVIFQLVHLEPDPSWRFVSVRGLITN